jgi:hypothetical protein
MPSTTSTTVQMRTKLSQLGSGNTTEQQGPAPARQDQNENDK